ncbi:MAG: hypothetical protein LBV36_03120 [Chromatiales bacterium]|jgi:RHS repeat-associated protein|nr:hypothetical protein [Chromatiales bacterium]
MGHLTQPTARYTIPPKQISSAQIKKTKWLLMREGAMLFNAFKGREWILFGGYKFLRGLFGMKTKIALSALLVWLFGATASVSATTLDDYLYDLSTPLRIYQPDRTPWSSNFYSDANTACMAEMPAPFSTNPTISYSNPRAEYSTSYGFGCTYDLTYTYSYNRVDTYPNTFYQNWVHVMGICPNGATLNSNGLCQIARQPEMGACDRTGNPIFLGRSCKIQTEVDYQGAASHGALFFARQYSSWHFKPIPNRLGANWSISVFGRFLTFDSNPTFIAATRALADTHGWDLTNGVWVARAPSGDQLATYADGNGSAYRYYDSARQAYEFYDANGLLLRIQQLNGDLYTLTYSTSTTSSSIAPFPGLLIAIAASNGAQLSLTYNSQGLLTTMQDPGGQIYTYAYGDGSDDVPSQYLKSVTYPDTSTRQYKYEAAYGPMNGYTSSPPTAPFSSAQLSALGQVVGATATPADATYVETYRPVPMQNALYPLTGIVDESGNRYATWQYDSKGRPTLSTHANGAESVSLAYPTANSVQITSTLGNVNTYNYTNQSTSRRVLSSISGNPCLACGRYKNFYYNSNGTIFQAMDWNSVFTTYAYDNLGQETTRTEGNGSATPRTISTQWHSVYHLPMVVSVYNSGSASGTPLRTTTFTYDSNGNQLTKTITDPNASTSRTWTYTYDNYGQILTVDGPRTDLSDITTLAYDASGNLSSLTNALGHVTQFTSYDAHGHPLTVIDPNGVTTTLTYDLRSRLTSRATAGETTSFTYDNVGQVTRVTLPGGSYLDYTYDAAHRLTSVADRLGNRIDYTLDAMGNRIEENVYDPYSALTQTRSRVYSAINRLTQDLGAQSQSTSYVYDANGNLTSSVDPLSRTTSQTFDSLNRLTKIVDPAAGATSFIYNLLDQLTKVTDPRGKATSYTFDALDNLKQIASPDTGTTNNTYDAAGNLLTSTDARGAVTSYSYDALNRVTQVSAALGGSAVTTTFQYDTGSHGIGRLTSITDAHGTTSYSYNAHGRLTAKTQKVGTISLTTSYAYDSAGRLAQMTYPSGKVISYSYDAQSRISTVKIGSVALLDDVSYAPFGGAIGWSWGGIGGYSRPLDSDGRVASYTLAGTTVLLDYDDASRLTAANSDTYGYDSLDRLTSYAGAAYQSFSYDAVGNRTAFTENSNSDSYSISTTGNRLLSISGANTRSYSYAANGAITGDGAHTYSYDPRGRLTGVDGSISYTLNGLGERIRKTVGGTSILFVYDEQGQLIGEYDGAGTPITETVYLDTQPVGVLKGSAIYYVHTDHLNTPRVITTTTGTIVWRWDSDPFGTTAANDDPDMDSVSFSYNLRFPGQYYDQETGLHYNYLRDGYDPTTGRYTQSDPIGLMGGLSTYGYVGGNPIGFYDPQGLLAMPGLPQWLVDGVAGFGDQAFNLATFGLGDLQDVRNALGVDGGVNQCSNAYSAGQWSMTAASFVSASSMIVRSIYRNVAKTPLALPHPKYLFKADEAVVHFDKHAGSIMNAMGNKSYNLAQYVDDANHIIQNGTWVPEMNGFVRLIGGQGSAKFGFVGLQRGSSSITTFHIKTASELAKKAPSLGITP